MNILVTVGTTPFNSLIESTSNSKLFKESGFNWTLQTGQIDSNLPLHKTLADSYHEIIDFYHADTHVYFERFDLIVSHAGSGSVFAALRLGKKLLVVPNLDRADQHQSELAEWLKSQNYCAVSNLIDFDSTLLNLINSQSYDLFLEESFDVIKFFDICDRELLK